MVNARRLRLDGNGVRHRRRKHISKKNDENFQMTCRYRASYGQNTMEYSVPENQGRPSRTQRGGGDGETRRLSASDNDTRGDRRHEAHQTHLRNSVFLRETLLRPGSAAATAPEQTLTAERKLTAVLSSQRLNRMHDANVAVVPHRTTDDVIYEYPLSVAT